MKWKPIYSFLLLDFLISNSLWLNIVHPSKELIERTASGDEQYFTLLISLLAARLIFPMIYLPMSYLFKWELTKRSAMITMLYGTLSLIDIYNFLALSYTVTIWLSMIIFFIGLFIIDLLNQRE